MNLRPISCLLVTASLALVGAPQLAQCQDATVTAQLGQVSLVERDGKILFQQAKGLADFKRGTKVTAATKFRIGSVSKEFTAAAILRLSEQGKLQLTDSLEKYVPGYPNGRTITLRQLLTHTSGLANYTSAPNFSADVVRPVTEADLVAKTKTAPALFKPGAGFAYCNTGYFLLSVIVERVSQKTFGDYLRDEFFTPLNLRDTGVYRNASPPADVARGAALTGGQLEVAPDWDMSWAQGCGSLYSTAGDLAKWSAALFGGQVLRPDSLRAATMPEPLPAVLPAGTDDWQYGYGLVNTTLGGLRMASHSGGLAGFSCELIQFPDQNTTVVVLGNTFPTTPEAGTFQAAKDLANTYLAADMKRVPALTAMKMDPAKLAEYDGRYAWPGSEFVVGEENGHLMGQLQGQAPAELFASAPDAFFWKVTDAHIQFLRDSNGKIASAQVFDKGNSFRIRPLPGDKDFKVPASQLAAYLGRYNYGGAVLTVTRENDQLFAQLTNQPKFPIYPIAKDTFEWRVIYARVKFVRNRKKVVIGAIHEQNGTTFQAVKLK